LIIVVLLLPLGRGALLAVVGVEHLGAQAVELVARQDGEDVPSQFQRLLDGAVIGLGLGQEPPR